MIDPLSILAVFGPLAVDLGKAVIGRFINGEGGFKPATIDDALKMRASDVEMFKAMNEAGAGGGASYPWVDAIVRLQRPAVAAVALGVWAAGELASPGGASDAVRNFAAAVGFYLFGDRTLFYRSKGQR
jgi:hypothetical protein